MFAPVYLLFLLFFSIDMITLSSSVVSLDCLIYIVSTSMIASTIVIAEISRMILGTSIPNSRSCTLSGCQVSCSIAHHRIISYRFSDLNSIIRRETDGNVDAETRIFPLHSKEPENDSLFSMLIPCLYPGSKDLQISFLLSPTQRLKKVR